MNSLNAKVKKCCGLHIHHDAADLDTINDFNKIHKLYQRIEKQIDSFMPVSRRKNNNSMCASLVGSRFTRRNRYRKVNFAAYFRHGTVEFRQHSGTVEFNKIYNWLIFTQKIVEFVKASGRIPSRTINFFDKVCDLLNLTADVRTYFAGRVEALSTVSNHQAVNA